VFLAVLVINTDNYTAFQYADLVTCTVIADLGQTISQPHNLKTVSTICCTRSERKSEDHGPCASG
jgi:hypothetical protein